LIRAAPDVVWRALLTHEFGASPLTKALFFLRGYGRRALRAGSGTLPEKIVHFGFTKLEELPEREVVFGIAGRFWRPDGDLRRLADRDDFVAFAEDGCVKGAWNLRVEPAEGGTTRLSTETRMAYFSPAARRKFRLYWTLVGPFSGLIRRALLSGIRRRAEVDR
jgi:hypothetical protein